MKATECPDCHKKDVDIRAGKDGVYLICNNCKNIEAFEVVPPTTKPPTMEHRPIAFTLCVLKDMTDNNTKLMDIINRVEQRVSALECAIGRTE